LLKWTDLENDKLKIYVKILPNPLVLQNIQKNLNYAFNTSGCSGCIGVSFVSLNGECITPIGL